MTLADYISALKTAPHSLTFEDTLAVIEASYDFTPTDFQNGSVHNAAGTNSGSCKVFSFAKAQELTPSQTLHMFAQHYQNVLDNPDADNHGNIRAFMKNGFDGLTFDGQPLVAK